MPTLKPNGRLGLVLHPRAPIRRRWSGSSRAGREVIDYYVRMLADPDSLRGSFGWYRAFDTRRTIGPVPQRTGRGYVGCLAMSTSGTVLNLFGGNRE
jgi:hypothetical protein